MLIERLISRAAQICHLPFAICHLEFGEQEIGRWILLHIEVWVI